MNNIRFVIDSSLSALYESRMLDFNAEKHVSTGRKSCDR